MRALTTLLAVGLMTAAETAAAQTLATGCFTCPAMPCIAGDVYHASTAAESFLRGQAAVIQAGAVWNLLSSQAVINMEIARQQELDNHLKKIQTYYDGREESRRRQAAEEIGKRHSAEDYARYAKQANPRPLCPHELDPRSGVICWPNALRSDQFTPQREILAEVFARRALNGRFDSPDLQEVRQTTTVMLSQLQGQVRTLPAAEYMAGKRFLESVAFQASQPDPLAAAPALAAR
jgi:hypothetical protein